MNVVIRADAATHIGTGHVMRCLTLARGLQQRGAKVLFVCKDHPGHLANYIEAQGYLVALTRPAEVGKNQYLHSSWLAGDEQDDVAQTIFASRQNFGAQIDVVIVDHYGIARPWEAQMGCVAQKVVVIDDLADRQHECDLLVDQTFGRVADDYRPWVNHTCTLLVGARYIILRDEFLRYSVESIIEKRSKVDCDSLNVLVMMGGTDPDNFTLKAIQAVESNHHVQRIDIVLSAFAQHIQDLQALYSDNGRIQLHVSPANVAELLICSDVAIGAGGGSSWERCRMGLPTILSVNATNQAHIVEQLTNQGICSRIEPDSFSDSISCFFKSLFKSGSYMQMVRRCVAVCDGFGGQRIIERIFARV